ncbi:hypothetical protein BVG16_02580 [Paenibacillus selenitireducens]|uniref:DNA helicase UvrC n=1 Tax=Paenibacillus selenitireducens TaxID=1324314 RepID=A0A1T2XNA7_9BACL|nr:GIY-YIG nuclease family protein [Paenibacillus selenitireducens]OPA81226.1 hypothetical protein BVG16_02580 [Paenibacillus selenitireducens]
MLLMDQVHNLPSTPGVYLMKDSLGSIIYVGKSKHLRERVQSYFYNSKSHSQKVKKLASHIRSLDHIVTDTEFEAFMLECKLIQELKPMYNKKMKNPHAYTYIKIKRNEGLHRIATTHTTSDGDDCYYFGPYTASKFTLDKAIQGIQECFRIACNQSNTTKGACLNYSLGLCLGMCLGGDAVQQYNDIIARFIALLDGTNRSLFEELEQKMLAAAEQYDFETAAKYRDYIETVNILINKKKVSEFSKTNENLVILENLNEDTVKLFLVNRNSIIYHEKHNVDSAGMGRLQSKVKSLILEYFKPEKARLSNEVNRDEIDHAQIIYSYVQGSACSYIHILEEWLELENQAELGEALNAFLCRPEQNLQVT